MAKILLVDDNVDVRDSYEDILTSAGYEVDVAIGGSEAINKLVIGGYDLVLLDLMMPKIDGFIVLQSLKDNPPIRPVGAVIVLTNLANDPLLKRALAMGASSYIIKSDEAPDQLLAKIKSVIH